MKKIDRVPENRILERFMSDDLVTRYDASAMFGPAGPEDFRHKQYEHNGELRWGTENRTLGLGWLLYGFIRAIRPKVILEIGCGGSTFCLLWGLRHNQFYPERQGHLWGIDPFLWGNITERNGVEHTSSYWHFIDTLNELEMQDLCTFYHEKSHFIGDGRWGQPIDMLVVDGDHDAEAVRQDWDDFSKWIVPGGYAFFHDAVAVPDNIGIMVERACLDGEFQFMLEPDHLSYAIIQKKFTVDFDAVWETRYRATLADRESTPFHLTDARGCGVVKPWQGSYFPSMEEWQLAFKRYSEKHE